MSAPNASASASESVASPHAPAGAAAHAPHTPSATRSAETAVPTTAKSAIGKKLAKKYARCRWYAPLKMMGGSRPVKKNAASNPSS